MSNSRTFTNNHKFLTISRPQTWKSINLPTNFIDTFLISSIAQVIIFTVVLVYYFYMTKFNFEWSQIFSYKGQFVIFYYFELVAFILGFVFLLLGLVNLSYFFEVNRRGKSENSSSNNNNEASRESQNQNSESLEPILKVDPNNKSQTTAYTWLSNDRRSEYCVSSDVSHTSCKNIVRTNNNTNCNKKIQPNPSKLHCYSFILISFLQLASWITLFIFASLYEANSTGVEISFDRHWTMEFENYISFTFPFYAFEIPNSADYHRIINEELIETEYQEHRAINYLQETYQCCGYMTEQEYTDKIMNFEPFDGKRLGHPISCDYALENQSFLEEKRNDPSIGCYHQLLRVYRKFRRIFVIFTGIMIISSFTTLCSHIVILIYLCKFLYKNL